MRCKSVLTRIDALRTGELEPDEKHELEQHLGDCPSCEESTSDLAELASVAKALIAAPAHSCADAVCESVRENFGSFEHEGRRIWVVHSRRGVRAITTGEWTADDFRRRFPALELQEAPVPDDLREAIVHVLRGEDPGEVALDLSGLTEFERAVLGTIRRIPRGEVRSYRWVAQQVGRPAAVRAVGNVMARNPIPLILPCHRVVPNAGGVGNYGLGPAMKREILSAEGVPVEELEDLAKHRIRFVGSRTTNIYCYPTCRDARRIRPANRVLFHDEAEAAASKFRPCKRCAPGASKAS